MLLELADQSGETETLMIDATQLKTHRTASNLGQEKGGRGRLIGRTKGGMNSKLHAVTDAIGRPMRLFLTAGQRSDYIGARALLSSLPSAKHMLADRGYDADWYRQALEGKGIKPCIPSQKGRKVPIPHDTKNATKSRTALPTSRTGGGWQRDTTDAQRSSSQQSHSSQSLFTGYES